MSHPLTRSEFATAGTRMPVWHRAGDGTRTALLLHGACADHRSMLPLLTAFDDDVDVLIPDLRGQGEHALADGSRADFKSIVADLIALVAGRSDVVIVGHSFGSHVAQELAVRLPDVSALVLIGCYDQHAPADRAERSRIAVTTAIVRALPWRWFARLSAVAATRDASIREALFESHLVAGREVFLELGRSGSAAKRGVEAYGFPVLAVRGEREYSTALASIHERVVARSARGETVAIAGTGHLCHEEDPGAVVTAIRAFLASGR